MKKRPKNFLRTKFAKRMSEAPSEVYGSQDFKRCGKNLSANTILSTLHNMKESKQVKRVGYGQYMLTKAGFKLASAAA